MSERLDEYSVAGSPEAGSPLDTATPPTPDALAVLDFTEIERRTAEAFERIARAVDRREQQWGRHPGKSAAPGKPRLPAVTSWRDLAACRNQEGDWVEVPRYGLARQRVEKQRELAFCRVCPVRVQCLEHADKVGIWGGLLPKERRTR